MSFRRRSTPLSGTSPSPSPSPSHPTPGIRPSPTSGIPVTSTGTPTLDALLTPHSGLALGTCLLIEENGVTDFAGALLRYYAAEGVVQGHVVHVVGVGEGWGRELPGLVVGKGESVVEGEERDGGKMKIAWRYERLGEVGGARAPPTPIRGPKAAETKKVEPTPPTPFCHTFDLTKRLTLPPGTSINYIPISPTSNPYDSILPTLTHSLTTTPPHTIHRLIIPTLLSPALYPPQSSSLPTHLLPFLHSLRSLLRTHSTRLTALLTLPLSLHSRSTGLVRMIEHLADGVLELVPFPHSTEVDVVAPGKKGEGGGGGELSEKPQGMAKVHKLPVVTEKGGGGGGGDELAFELSRKRFVIGKFSLPPVDGGEEVRRGEVKVDVEF